MPHSKQNRSFRDVLSGQALGLVLKKLNLTQEKQTTQEQKNGKNTQQVNLYLKKT